MKTSFVIVTDLCKLFYLLVRVIQASMNKMTEIFQIRLSNVYCWEKIKSWYTDENFTQMS